MTRITAFIAAVCMAVTLPGGAIGSDPKEPEIITGLATAMDGDTIHIGKRKIRLWGIDTPEMRTPLGPIARARLDRFIEGQDVTCVVRDRDKYKRAVALCGTSAAPDLAIAMLRQGLATVYRTFTVSFPEAAAYDAAEREGQETGKGIWAAGREPSFDWNSAIPLVIGAFLAALSGFGSSVIWHFFNKSLARKNAIRIVIEEMSMNLQVSRDHINYLRKLNITGLASVLVPKPSTKSRTDALTGNAQVMSTLNVDELTMLTRYLNELSIESGLIKFAAENMPVRYSGPESHYAFKLESVRIDMQRYEACALGQYLNILRSIVEATPRWCHPSGVKELIDTVDKETEEVRKWAK
jgi:endonuclease YncB( thermonuclease family)